MALNTMGQHYENQESIQQNAEMKEFSKNLNTLEQDHEITDEVLANNPDIIDKLALEAGIKNILGAETFNKIFDLLKEQGVNEIYENIAPKKEYTPDLQSALADTTTEAVTQPGQVESQEAEISAVEAPMEDAEEAEITPEELTDLVERAEKVEAEDIPAEQLAEAQGDVVEHVVAGMDSHTPTLKGASTAFINAAQRAAPPTRSQTEELQIQKKQISEFMVDNLMTPDFAGQLARDILVA